MLCIISVSLMLFPLIVHFLSILGEVPWITHPSFSAHVSRTAMMMSPEMTRAALKTARRSARGPWNSSWLVSDAFHLVTLESTGGMPKQNGEVQKHGNNHWWIMVNCDELWWVVMNYHALMNCCYFPMATKIGCLPIVWPGKEEQKPQSTEIQESILGLVRISRWQLKWIKNEWSCTVWKLMKGKWHVYIQTTHPKKHIQT